MTSDLIFLERFYNLSFPDINILILFCFSWGEVRLSPVGTAVTTGLLYQPQMIADDDCGTVDGMKIGKENRSTRRKPAAVPLCPPQITHELSRTRTHAAVVRSQRLTA
jgi:hypothetical protein